MKKISISLLIILFTAMSNLAASEKIGSQHEYGLGILGSYEYEETQLMHLRGGQQAESHNLENLGLIYNYKNNFLLNEYYTEFEFDNSYQFLNQSYWSQTTGTMEDIDVEVYNTRLLYGINLSEKLMLKSGLGYRYLYHFWENRKSSTGANGYDREQDYIYIPLIAELKAPIPELGIDGKLKVEFDHVMKGTNNSYAGYLGGANRDTQHQNDDGYIWKVSYAANYSGYIVEPYYEFMSIQESTIDVSTIEPSNTTKEIGIRFKKAFASNITSDNSDYKTLVDDDSYYFGTRLLSSVVESGFSQGTGTANIEERDGLGYSIISGANLSDFLDLEFAFNQFGQSGLKCNTGDTVKTDGRFANHTYSSGTTLSCNADNIQILIESYSTSVGVKPKIEYTANNIDLTINLDFGFHRWDQSESNTTRAVSTSTEDYSGINHYYGLGISGGYNNFNIDFAFLYHDMFYDAESLGASLSYKF